MNFSDMPFDAGYDVLLQIGNSKVCSACKSLNFRGHGVYYASRPAVIPPWWAAMFVKEEKATRAYLAVTCFDCGKVHQVRPGSLPPFTDVTDIENKNYWEK